MSPVRRRHRDEARDEAVEQISGRFLTLPSGKRFALVGDLVWQREGITEREERPWLVRALGADASSELVRAGILHMSSLSAGLPSLVLVPAHDSRSFAEMPLLE